MANTFYQANVTDMAGLINYANNLSGGIMTPLFVLAVWIIVFTYTLNEGFSKAFIGASFVSFVVSVLFIAMGIMSGGFIILNLALLAIGGILLWRG
jgi:hypothetical protein